MKVDIEKIKLERDKLRKEHSKSSEVYFGWSISLNSSLEVVVCFYIQGPLGNFRFISTKPIEHFQKEN